MTPWVAAAGAGRGISFGIIAQRDCRPTPAGVTRPAEVGFGLGWWWHRRLRAGGEHALFHLLDSFIRFLFPLALAVQIKRGAVSPKTTS